MEKEKNNTERLNKSLLDAINEGNIENAKKALEAGADVNAKDEIGWTTLNRAIIKNENEIAKFLIENGADIEIKVNGYTWTALDLAAKNGNLDIVLMLIKRGVGTKAKNEALRLAAWHGNIEIVNLLIASGADVNAKDDTNGASALHFAVSQNKEEMVSFLIQNKAKIDARDNKEWTPLHYAAHNENIKIAKMLIANGAEVNAMDKNGFTAGDYLGYSKIKEIVIEVSNEKRWAEEEKQAEKALDACNATKTSDPKDAILKKFWRQGG